jgi:hypothetical protein
VETLVALPLLALALAAALLLPRAVDAWQRRLHRRLRRGDAGTWAGALAIAAFAGEALVALAAGVPVPHVHDEWSYLLAGDTFAHGRLANPTHPLSRHFETFHVLLQPTYASKYPPGQGLVLAAGELLGHPALGIWLSGALFVAAATWALHGWVRRPWARLGALLVTVMLVVASPWAQSYWGGFVPALGGALLFGALPRLRRTVRVRDGIALGGGMAVLAASRPWEGAVAAATALALLLTAGWWSWGRSTQRAGARVGARASRTPHGGRVVATAIAASAIVAATAVGLAVQNWRVTGDPLRLPYRVYDARYARVPVFLWQQPRAPLEENPPAPMETFYRTFEAASWREQHTWAGWWRATGRKLTVAWEFYVGAAGTPLLLALVWPVAPRRVPSARRHRVRGAAAAAFACVLASQLVILPLRPHYLAPGALLVTVLLVDGWRRLRCWRCRGRPLGRRFAAATALVLLAMLVPRTLLLRPPADAWELRRDGLARRLARRAAPQLVLVEYGPAHGPQAEWVYNGADLLAPKVLWARALSPREDCALVAVSRGREAWLLRVEEDLTAPRLAPFDRARCTR